MNKNHHSLDIDVAILCGGLGTRLRPVIGERQKVAAPIGGRPFIEYLIEQFAESGFRRFIMCTGYNAAEVEQALQKFGKEFEFVFSHEATPLGTGGAVKKALPHVKSVRFFVINGDTFCDIDLLDFLRFHQEQQSLCTIALSRSDRDDGGTIMVEGNKIVTFKEKQKPNPQSYINSGMYLMEGGISELMIETDIFSLEHDFFPKVAESGRCFGYVMQGSVIDIGTPARFNEAPEVLKAKNKR